MQIHVGIVENHDSALPFYYSLIRKKLIPSTNMQLIHFDAHPDLSIPSHTATTTTATNKSDNMTSSASSVSQWNDLFVLESLLAGTEGGIAEWILPLVYNQIFKKVVWVRSHFSSQFNNGIYEFCLGDAMSGSATAPKACISLAEPYYNVENVVVAATDMITKTVKYGSLEVMLVDELDTITLQQCYVLDICLDYFSTENPFLKELNRLIALDLSSLEGQTSDNVIDNIVAVMNLTQKQFKSAGDKESYECNLCILSDVLHNDSLRMYPLITGEYAELIEKFHGNMRLLSSQTRQYIWNHRTLLNLPHYVATEEQLDRSLDAVKSRLSLFIQKNGLPSAISIARSVDDGYTPQSFVSDLQTRVLHILEYIVGSTHSLVVHELTGADAWHDIFTMFLNKKCKRYVNIESDDEGVTQLSEANKMQKV